MEYYDFENQRKLFISSNYKIHLEKLNKSFPKKYGAKFFKLCFHHKLQN